MSRRFAPGLVAVGLAAAGAVLAAPAGAAPTGLNITLTDGVSQTRSGASLTYVATVTDSARPITGVLVLQLPAHGRVITADGGRIAHSTVSWPVTVHAGKPTSRTVRVGVGTIPRGQMQVLTLASFYRGKAVTGVPIVRTADADHVAGVADPVPPPTTSKKPVAAPAPRRPDHGSAGLWLTGLPAFVVLLLVGAGVSWRRRKRHRLPVAAEPDRETALAGGTGRHRAVLVSCEAGRPRRPRHQGS